MNNDLQRGTVWPTEISFHKIYKCQILVPEKISRTCSKNGIVVSWNQFRKKARMGKPRDDLKSKKQLKQDAKKSLIYIKSKLKQLQIYVSTNL